MHLRDRDDVAKLWEHRAAGILSDPTADHVMRVWQHEVNQTLYERELKANGAAASDN
jgi:hypothetical protein